MHNCVPWGDYKYDNCVIKTDAQSFYIQFVENGGGTLKV